MKLITNNKIKYPLVILLALSIIAGGFYYFFNKDVEEAAAWFNDDWSYRQAVPITNAGTALTDYQVSFTLNTSALISAGKMQADCDDLRVADFQGNVLPYWIEENNPGCNQTATRIWTKLPSIPVTTINIFVYYGNTQASSLQKGSDVFTFFDDFNSTTLNSSKWSVYAGAPTLSGGYINFAAATDSGIKSVNTSWFGSGNYSIETLQRVVGGSNTFNFGVSDTFSGLEPGVSENDLQLCLTCGNTTWRFRNQSNVDYCSSAKDTENEWRVSRINYIAGTSAAAYNYSNNRGTTTQTCTTSTSLPTMTGFNTIHFKSFAKDAQIDWVIVRKFAATEPTIGSLGSEEKGGGPVGYWRFDEGQGNTAYDSTTNAKNGTINGTAWRTEDQCMSGKCLEFDGTGANTSSVQAGDISTANFGTEDFSVGVFVRRQQFGPIAVGENYGYGGILDKRYYQSLAGNIGWSLMADAGNIKFEISNGTAEDSLVLGSEATIFPKNEWVQIYVTVTRGGNIVAYKNGVQIATTPVTISGTISNTESFDIASSGGFTSYGLKGFIDDVKIYKYARSANQVKADYNAAKAGSGSAEGASAVMGARSQKWMSDGLVGYWKMDEASWNGTAGEVIDSSGNSNNGTAVNSATTATAKFGNGGNINGATVRQGVTVANNASLNFGTGGFSLFTWVKSSQTGVWKRLITKRGSAASWYSLAMSNGVLTAEIYGPGASRTFSSSTTINNGAWHHVGVVRDAVNNQLLLYIDGAQAGTSPDGVGNLTNSEILEFGRWSTEAYDTGSYTGMMDEVRIYNRSLSSQEAADLYNWAPGPVGYWNFEEGSGNTAYDRSSNSNNSSITNTSYIPGHPGWGLKNNINNAGLTLGAPITFGANFTFGFWTRKIANMVPATDQWQIFLGDNASNDIFFIGDGGSTSKFGSDVIGAWNYEWNTLTNDWHHVTYVRQDPYHRLYIDGVLKDTITNATYLSPSLTRLMAWGANPAQFGFNRGYYDELKFYNYARTPKQIQEDMNTGVGGPVGYWRFDEGQGTTANNDITNGVSGSIANGIWTSAGKAGKALSFNGTSSVVTVAAPLGTAAPSQLTLSTWFKRTRSGTQEFLFDSDGDESTILILANDKIRCEYWNGTAAQYTDSNRTITDTNWHHVACVLDYANSVKVYIDGKLDNTNSAPSGALGNGALTNSYIGARGTTTNFFSGLIDEAKMYAYALTESEVKQDYNLGSATSIGAGTESGNTGSAPIAWWKLDDNTGATAVDSSGNSRDGVVANANWGAGKSGSALRFNGSTSKVSKTSFNFSSNNYTAELWVKPGATQVSYAMLFDYNHCAGVNWGMQQNASNLNQYYTFYRGTDAAWHDNASAPIQLAAGQWQHVAVVKNAANLKVYVNGILKSDVNQTIDTINYSNEVMNVGNGCSDARPFNGMLDDFKVYDYARTQAQIAYDFSRGEPVAYWSMDEGDGNTVRDFGINNYNGTLTVGGGGTQSTIAQAWSNGASGKYGKSLNFDGTDDYVAVGNFTPITSGADWSVAFWMNSSSVANYRNAFDANFVSGGNNAGPRFEQYGSGTFQLFLGTDVSNYNSYTYTTSLQPNTWYHVVAIRSGSNIVGYLNGVQVFNSGNSLWPTSFSNVNIGRGFSTSAERWFSGKLDDVRIYNYALDATQIKQAMIQGAAARF